MKVPSSHDPQRRRRPKKEPLSTRHRAMAAIVFVVVVFLCMRQVYAVLGPQEFRRIFGLGQDSTVSELEKLHDPNVSAERAQRMLEHHLQSKYWSKKQLRDQMCVYRDGNRFDCKDVDLALNNVEVDWKEHALYSAEQYLAYRPLSKARLYEELTSEVGGGFTAEEGRYAVENVDADWKQNALEAAREIREESSFSDEAMIKRLTNPDLEAFTEEEARWALANLGKS